MRRKKAVCSGSDFSRSAFDGRLFYGNGRIERKLWQCPLWGLRKFAVETVSSVSYLKSLSAASLRQSGFLCDVLEFLQAGVSHTGWTTAFRTACSLGTGQIPVSGKKDDSLSVYDSDDSVLSFLRVLDTHWSVILPGIFSTFPVFLMTKFFQQIPDTLLEAAKVDGAGVAASFFYIGLPLGIPGVVSSLILNFLEYWNAIEAPMFPVSLYLSNITIHDMGTAFAASILIMAPSVFLFACGQNYLEQGILASGLKE